MADKQQTVTLKADGIKDREVSYVKYTLNQQTDVEGQPTGTTRGGQIELHVKSTPDGNTDILEWMCDSYMSKNGSITFPNHKGGDMKKLEFTEGYVVKYSETFDDSDANRQMEEFIISAREIKVGNAHHNNRWASDD